MIKNYRYEESKSEIICQVNRIKSFTVKEHSC